MATPRPTTPPTIIDAVQYDRYGGPDVLELRRIPLPPPAADEVLVRVRASGLNPKDAILRAGGLRFMSGTAFPKGTGFDLAGDVVAVGAGVRGFEPEEPVWGFLDGADGGAAAEYVAVPQSWLGPMPGELSYPEAAALPLVGSTALQALRDAARLEAGDAVLVNGASGGVGSAAVQIATAMGARVTAVASAANLAHCRALGADAAIDYRSTDPRELPERFDVVLDLHGSLPYGRARRLLTRRGRHVTIAPKLATLATRFLARLLPGPTADIVFVKPRRADLDALADLVAEGRLRMPLERSYPLSEVRAAHTDVATLHARGKRVLLVSAAEPPTNAPDLARAASGTAAT